MCHIFHTCAADINECETGVASCVTDATCTDTFGSFECMCNEGFLGDGRTECLSEYMAFLNHL